MKRILHHILLYLLLATATGEAALKNPNTYRPKVNDALAAETRKDNLKLLYFTADWCGPCKLMKSKTWPNTEVQKALAEYTFEVIDIDREPREAKHWGVQSIPTYIITDNREAYTLVRSGGFKDPDQMTVWLDENKQSALQALQTLRAEKTEREAYTKHINLLFENTSSLDAADLHSAREAIYALLQHRKNGSSQSDEALDLQLMALCEEKPNLLIDGLLHPDLQVRVRLARILANSGIVIDPWSDAGERKKSVTQWKNTFEAKD